ncbi:MAG: zf-HC2 domain-containing protein [Pyrinomonadaceae bacterium]
MKNYSDIKVESCSLSGDLVAYLYNELNASGRRTFETHLAECGSCTDEFADLSFARLDVYEWHRDEFAVMETPRIVIPYTEASISWMDAVRIFLASNGQWVTAGGAAALIAVILGSIFVLLTIQGNDDTAQVLATGDAASNQVQSTLLPATPPIVQVKDVTASVPAGVRSSETQVVKTSAARKDSTAVTSPKRRSIKNSERVPAQPVQARRTGAPRLNDFDDEDDNTLRLGDLLADVDSRD